MAVQECQTPKEVPSWHQAVRDQLSSYPILQSIPELKVFYSTELGRTSKLQDASQLSLEGLSSDENTLQQLSNGGQFRAAFSLTTKLLSNEADTASALKLWQTRINIFIRLGAFSEARHEIDQFSQLEDLPIQFGQNSTNGGVPFTLLLSVAHLLILCGCCDRAQSKLTKLLHQCSENIDYFRGKNNEQLVQLWEERQLKVLSMLVNYAVEQNDFKFAIDSLNEFCEHQKDPLDIAKTKSMIGKLFLQFGDLSTAEAYFQKAANLYHGLEGQIQNLKNNSFLSIANGDYQAAYTSYKDALKLQPGHPTFINNMAVCALYMGRSAEGVQLIETALSSNPASTLNECTVANICALYRLQSSIGEAKKVFVKDMVAKHCPETFNCQALQLEG